MKDVGGGEFYQFYRYDTASGDTTLLTDGKSRNEAITWTHDGSKIAYGSTRRDGNDVDIWVMDPADPKTDHMLAKLDGGGWEPLDWSRDGRKLLVMNELSAQESYLWLMDSSSGEKTLLTPKGGAKVHYVGGRFSNDGKGIYVTTDKDSEFHRLTYIELPSKQHTYLNLQTEKVDRWTFSETGRLNTATLPEPELIFWKSWDGRRISGFLYRPLAKFTGKRPVIVNIHGGPEGQFRSGFAGRWNYYLNELGIAMIAPNVRGSTGYGKTFLSLDNGFLREGSYKDINALFDWIQQQPDLDSGRVMVTGGSYGGFMTLAVATNYNDRICCSVDVVGPSNLVTFLEHTSGYRQDLRRVEYGDERDLKMREFLNRSRRQIKQKTSPRQSL